MIMKTLIAAFAVALSLAAALPASVGYVSPSDTKAQQAFTVGVP